MTSSPGSPAPGTAEAPTPSSDDAAPAGPAPSTEHSPQRSLWWRIGFPVALVVLILAIPALVWAGTRVLLDSNDGQLVGRVTDPTEPGWEAVLEPTPTELVLTVGAANDLQGVAVLILSGDDSGAVLQLPPETIVERPGAELTLAFLWAFFGEEAVRDGASEILNLGFTDTQVIRPDRWPTLLAPVSPLTINSPDPAVGAEGQIVFPRGSIEVPGEQIAAYLATRSSTEADVARLVRVESFWRAWLTATGTAGLQSVPQPVEQGLGRFVGALGTGQVQFVTLPVTQEGVVPGEFYRPQSEEVAATVAELVPFPVGPPGGRTTIRVLDATGQLDHGTTAAVTLGAASGQVEVIGNAAEFGDPVSQIIYFDDATLADAERLRAALGVGELVRSQERSAVQVTVVLGADALGVPGIMPPPGAASAATGLGGVGG